MNMEFTFGEYKTNVYIDLELPSLDQIAACMGCETGYFKPLIICDENTAIIADKICGLQNPPRCILKSGEDSKSWESIQTILAAAKEAGLTRDGIFIGIGGGVIGDLTGYAASIYMRGCRLSLVSTTLLAMVDASVGGKTGIDLFGIKNLAGTFYPAETVFMPLNSLATLPEVEWKSGMAELIKTAVIEGDDFFDSISKIVSLCTKEAGTGNAFSGCQTLFKCIEHAVKCKGRIVSEDPREQGQQRRLLNLGHTFGHALEASAGLGKITHGEAVAWGIVRSCELGYTLGITPLDRAKKITELIALAGYHYTTPHPLAKNTEDIIIKLKNDKKKKQEKFIFIVPGKTGVVPVFIETNDELKIIENIFRGEFSY
jgi:3-dehydroquinate synthase